MRTLYLIDGISVTKQIYERRQLFGEHVGARFDTVSLRLKYDPRQRTQRFNPQQDSK